MYPNKIITQRLFPEHLGIEWLIGYTANKDKRLELKHLAKKDSRIKMIVDVLKLSLNGGGYGKTGDIWNWQYDPLVMYTTTIQTQLDILLLTDMLIQQVPLRLESGNTDGINIIYNKKYTDQVNQICKQWEQITQAELETTRYQKVIRTTVNDYMAIKDDGSVKYKGDFEKDKELHKDSSMYIVRKAIDEYYRFNVPVKTTIENCKDILSFTKNVRIQNTAQGKWKAVYDYIENGKLNRIEPGKNIRYYIDNTGQGKLYKSCYDGKSIGKLTNVEANASVTLFNKIINKPFDEYRINYKYYIVEAMKIINNVYDGQLKLF